MRRGSDAQRGRLGTAAGDWTLEITGWGPGVSVLLPAGLITLIVIGQRLVRVLTPSKEKHELSRDEQTQLERALDAGKVLKSLKEEAIIPQEATWKNVPFWKPVPSGLSRLMVA